MKSGWALGLVMLCACSGGSGATLGDPPMAAAEKVSDASAASDAHETTAPEASATDDAEEPGSDAGPSEEAAVPAIDAASTTDAPSSFPPIRCKEGGGAGTVYEACNGYGPTGQFDTFFFYPTAPQSGLTTTCTATNQQTGAYCPTGNYCDMGLYDAASMTSTNHRGTCIN